MQAWISETIVATPGLRINPMGITIHIMYNPPMTPPVGTSAALIKGPISGWSISLVANPKLANIAIKTRSMVAILRLPFGIFGFGKVVILSRYSKMVTSKN
jgi:hypothetical protein